jgi:hypothetical protein
MRGAHVAPRPFHRWDFTTFGRGERFINAPLPRQDFDEGLDQSLKNRNPETLSYPAR